MEPDAAHLETQVAEGAGKVVRASLGCYGIPADVGALLRVLRGVQGRFRAKNWTGGGGRCRPKGLFLVAGTTPADYETIPKVLTKKEKH